jgi:ABC-type antimicrobial peptide transport system permease subunit
MSETGFPINDLLRRKLQTILTVFSIATCVASTLFLLIFSGQIGLGIVSTSQGTLTSGTSIIFSQFLTFVGVLIFAVGAVIVSFIVFLMMAQRTKDYGLMKATGCPNGLVFGYFLTELLAITFIGCTIGIVLGFGTDYLVINMPMFQVYNKPPNFWFAPLVFATFFGFALIFGAKPLLDSARMSPARALSSSQYFGLSKGNRLKPLSKTGLTIRIALRSLYRRKNNTVRVVIFLSLVFLLLTVSIAGGIFAEDTSSSWVENSIGQNIILVANQNMATQYTQLLLTFSGAKATPNFNYSDAQFAISANVSSQLRGISGVSNIDARLVWSGTVQEVPGFKYDPDTLATMTVGGNRQSEALIIGINASSTATQPFTTGQFLNSTSKLEAVIGDSISQSTYTPFKTLISNREQTVFSDPLLESARFQNATFKIVGVCLDPTNNGNIIYIPLQQLESLIDIYSPNILLVKIDSSSYSSTLNQMQSKLLEINPDLVAVELNYALNQNVAFLSSIWGVIMFLPIFALAAAAFCLVSYLMITIEEQRQEFGILRAVGAKPKTIMTILGVQSLVLLLSSFGVGVSIGTMVCVIILIAKPVITGTSVLVISAWLFAALLGIFLVSFYPAAKFAKQTISRMMS